MRFVVLIRERPSFVSIPWFLLGTGEARLSVFLCIKICAGEEHDEEFRREDRRGIQGRGGKLHKKKSWCIS